MKKTALFLLVLTAFLSCKKEEVDISSSSITINYKVGDHFIYERKIVDYKADTFEILIPKDTLLNNKNCLVYIKREKGFSDDIIYIEQTDSSINVIGYWYTQNNEAIVFNTPKVLYLNPLKMGTNWLTWNMVDTGRMSVISTGSIRIGNKQHLCMKLKHHKDISEPENPKISSYLEYIDAKGLVFSSDYGQYTIRYENGVPVLSAPMTIEVRRISN